MDAVITRIIEIEKQSALDIEKAFEASRKKIEAHRLALEEKKEQSRAAILSAQKNRLIQALQVLNQQIENQSLAAGREYESRFQNPAVSAAVKEKITDLLLSG